MLPLLPHQCLLHVDMRFLSTELDSGSGPSQLWLDGVYLRYIRSSRSGLLRDALISSSGEMWLTGVTMQGSGGVTGGVDCIDSCAVWSGGSLYAEGVNLSSILFKFWIPGAHHPWIMCDTWQCCLLCMSPAHRAQQRRNLLWENYGTSSHEPPWDILQ